MLAPLIPAWAQQTYQTPPADLVKILDGDRSLASRRVVVLPAEEAVEAVMEPAGGQG